MDAERWRLVQDLLGRALELPEGERGAFLDAECPEADLRSDVASLIEAFDEAGSYFPDLTRRAGAGATLEEAPPASAGSADLVGRRVGAYELTGFLGRGGMGTVYLGERADGQFTQRVAIKLLAMGATHPDTHRRFLAEREILARLKHKNIAQLFDGGVTEDGTPYFVMELIEGTPIDAWCDERGLNLDERIELFLAVCDAVSYAHKNLVVHRDLKPSNILVADGHVQLLDFGIAKLLAGEDEPGGPATATGHSPMTPAYAAPEQLRAGAVTTATDVYTLGVVLHRLLTGLSPYGDVSGSGYEVIQVICEQTIASPSTRIRSGAGGVEVEALACARSTTPAVLARRLRGDLDTILLRALRKEPERRYESVAAFAEDLRRHLRDLPVLARRDTLAYRASRFLARHGVLAAAGGAVTLLIAALVVVSLWFAQRASSQEQRIANAQERASDLLGQLTDLYESADPAASPGETRASRRMLDTAVAALRAADIADPETRATLLFSAGRVYRRLGASAEALPLLEETLAIRRSLFEAPHEGIEEVLYESGANLARSARPEAGVARLQEALAMARELHGDAHLHVAQIRFELGVHYHDTGSGDSESEFEEAVRIYRALDLEPTGEYANALKSLGDIQSVRMDHTSALELYEEASEIYVGIFGRVHPQTAMALNGTGMLKYNLGAREEALELLRESVDINRAIYGEEGHVELAIVLQNLGNVLGSERDPEGVEYLREAVEVYRSLPSPRATDVGFCLTSYGNGLAHYGQVEEATAVYEEALGLYDEQDVQPMFREQTRLALARLLLREGPSQRARQLFEEVLAGYEGFLPDDHPRVEAVRRQLEEARGR